MGFDDFRIDYVCICLCGESFNLLKNSEKPVGEINRLSLTGPAVKRNFLGIAWRRWLYALVETLDSELYVLQPFVSKDNLAMDKI